jgi:hypothetical protein
MIFNLNIWQQTISEAEVGIGQPCFIRGQAGTVRQPPGRVSACPKPPSYSSSRPTFYGSLW